MPGNDLVVMPVDADRTSNILCLNVNQICNVASLGYPDDRTVAAFLVRVVKEVVPGPERSFVQ